MTDPILTDDQRAALYAVEQLTPALADRVSSHIWREWTTTVGLLRSLEHLGLVERGQLAYRLTPAGEVWAEVHREE